MPRVKVVFELPEEQEEYEVAMNGGKYAAAIAELLNWLWETQQDTIEVALVRGKLANICADLGVEVK